MKIKQRTWREEWDEYWLVCIGKRDGIHFSFPCSPDGTIEIDALKVPGKIAWENIQANKDEWDIEVQKCPQSYMHPTVIECCGQELQCGRFTNTCEVCGADYNWNGNRLTPRDQWGEETGEHPSDIARIH